MDREQAKTEIKKHLQEYVEKALKKSKGKDKYICPFCGSGTGPKGTGAFSINPNEPTKFHCFSCGKGGDIFDVIGQVENLPKPLDQLKRAAEIYNIDIDYNVKGEPKKVDKKAEKNINEQAADYTALFLAANKDIEKTDYHRSISLDTLNRFKIGYKKEWRHPKSPNSPTSPRLIIPTSKESYLARDTRQNLSEEQQRYSKSKVGSIHIFNLAALDNDKKPVFIVEGEIDALSIIDVGGEAVALGSTAKVKSFLEIVKAKRPTQPLIIALDNDEAGEKAAGELAAGLEALKIPFYRNNPAGQYKDANDALQANREALKNAVAVAERIQDDVEQAQREAYLKTSTANHIQSFVDGIADSVNTPFIPTGFKELDKVLEGGLYEGLYIVGAISSLGKTTLMTQIGDQIAQGDPPTRAGHDVLIFSLEMARTEIMAKSISRHTYESVLYNGGKVADAKTTRGITTASRYKNYSQTEKDLITSSIKEYSEYANHIYINEGIGDIGIEQIRETVRQHILFTGNIPLVIIDYLQIIEPYSERATDKQNTDKAVKELKRISREFKAPIVAISSFNRANYKEAVGMEAFKESGAIEYSSDVLIGLQLKGAGTKDFDATKAKKKEPREVELVILKQRNGRAGDSIIFDYYPLFNFFEELGKAEEEQ